MNADVRVIERLIDMQRDGLETLRKDLFTLGRLVEEHGERLEQARTEQILFAEEARKFEAELLVAAQMLDSRRYLAYLQQQTDLAEKMLHEVSEQKRHAQQAFDDCYAEIRKLECVVERRREAAKQELQRKSYVLADDMELVRVGRVGSMYGAN